MKQYWCEYKAIEMNSERSYPRVCFNRLSAVGGVRKVVWPSFLFQSCLWKLSGSFSHSSHITSKRSPRQKKIFFLIKFWVKVFPTARVNIFKQKRSKTKLINIITRWWIQKKIIEIIYLIFFFLRLRFSTTFHPTTFIHFKSITFI